MTTHTRARCGDRWQIARGCEGLMATHTRVRCTTGAEVVQRATQGQRVQAWCVVLAKRALHTHMLVVRAAHLAMVTVAQRFFQSQQQEHQKDPCSGI